MQIGYAAGASDGEMSQREIARRLNCSQSTTASRATKDITINALVPRPKHPGPNIRARQQTFCMYGNQRTKQIVGTLISRLTISRRLDKTGVKSYAARQKPFLKPEHREKRLQWALEHLHWTIEDWVGSYGPMNAV